MPERDLPPPTLPWWLITLGTLGLLGLYVLAVRTERGQLLDTLLMESVGAGDAAAQRLLRVIEVAGPVTMIVLCVLVCLLGLLRGRRTAFGAAVGAAVCLALPQVLKATLPRPQLADPWPLPNSLPSGHTAAVAAVVVALLVVVPRVWRAAVLLLGVPASAAMGVVVVALAHHRPSDVLASGCVGLIGWGAGLLVQGWRPQPPGWD